MRTVEGRGAQGLLRTDAPRAATRVVVHRGAASASIIVLVAVAAVTTSSCGSGRGMTSDAGASSTGLLCADAGGPTVGDLPCDVARVLKDKCQACHQEPPRSGAHFPLLTFEDTQQPFGITPGERRWQRMAQVIEPGTLPHMPYGSAPQLTPAEFLILRTWFRACAPPLPEGTGCDFIGDASADAVSDGPVTAPGTDAR